MAAKPETLLENYFKKQCAEKKIWQNKFTSGVTGVPDRIAVYNGKTVFVELKAKHGVLSDRQKRVIAQIRAHGGTVNVPKSKQDIDAIISLLTQGG
jgi:hypothetical protein